MPVERHTPQLDALLNLVQQLGGTRVITVNIPKRERAKLTNLTRTGRPFLGVTQGLQQAVIRYVRAAAGDVLTRAGNIRQNAFWDVAADAVKSHVLLRFREQGNDVNLKPLGPEYRAWKARHGYDTRIGFMTGDLYRALANAKWTIDAY